MKNNQIILTGAIIIGGYALYRYVQQSAETLDSLVITPSDISIDTTHTFSPTLYISFDCNNPTVSDITISHFFGKVLLNDEQIGTVNNSNIQTIKANSHSNIKLNVTVNTFSLITDLLTTDLKTVNLSFNGYVTANGLQTDLNMRFNSKGILGKKNKLPKQKNVNFLQLKSYYLEPSTMTLSVTFYVKGNIVNSKYNNCKPTNGSGVLNGSNVDGSHYVAYNIEGVIDSDPETYIAKERITVNFKASVVGYTGLHMVTEVDGYLDGNHFFFNTGN